MGIFGSNSGLTIANPDQAASRRDVFLMTYNAIGDSLDLSNKQDQVTKNLKGQTKDQMLKAFNSGQSYDKNLFQEEFLVLINADRRKLGLKDLAWDKDLDLGAGIRSEELNAYGSVSVNGQAHVRVDGRFWDTALDYMSADFFRTSRGENLAEVAYTTTAKDITSKSKDLMTDEKLLAKTFYDLWWSSPGHRASMMHPDFSYLSVQIRVGDYSKSSPPEKNTVLFTGTTIFRGDYR